MISVGQECWPGSQALSFFFSVEVLWSLCLWIPLSRRLSLTDVLHHLISAGGFFFLLKYHGIWSTCAVHAPHKQAHSHTNAPQALLWEGQNYIATPPKYLTTHERVVSLSYQTGYIYRGTTTAGNHIWMRHDSKPKQNLASPYLILALSWRFTKLLLIYWLIF